MKILIPQSVDPAGVNYLKEKGYEIIDMDGRSREEIADAIGECDAVLVRTMKFDESIISKGTKLKILARHGVGYDNVDTGAAAARGIWVTNTPTALSDSVAEFTIAMVLLAGKNIFPCSMAMREGNYDFKKSNKGFDMLGKTVGILGFGRIGRTVARKAYKGFEMKIIACDPFAVQSEVPEYVTLVDRQTLFAQSDFVCLHIPGGEKNQNSVGMSDFEQMKPTAALINVARGEVVDEEALDKALLKGMFRTAVLDVQKQEPPAADWPLYKNEKVICTPHMASNTEECMARMSLYAATQIHKVLSGEQPDWPVNQPVLK